jgi:ribosomal protein L6P/L9E
MKDIYKEESLDIPEGVTVTIKARIITVVGPRGTLQKVRFYLPNPAPKIYHDSERETWEIT